MTDIIRQHLTITELQCTVHILNKFKIYTRSKQTCPHSDARKLSALVFSTVICFNFLLLLITLPRADF